MKRKWVKRLFDIVFSTAMLTLGAPLFFIVALLIKSTSPGPIFYCSRRLGRFGKQFKFWKFRSMHVDAEQKLKTLLAQNPSLREEWALYFKLKEDPRCTRLGKFLRKTSLDEIPQFWNILKGDLSLVGPRPYLPNELSKIQSIIGEEWKLLFSVRPGLTGLWQTSGRSFLTFEDRVRLDLEYIDKRSFLYDLKLIAKTIPVIFFPNGAF